MIDEHEALIEEIAASEGEYVLQRDYEALEGQVFVLLHQCAEKPVLAPIPLEALPATPGSMMSHPTMSKSGLDVYRSNAALIRAALGD